VKYQCVMLNSNSSGHGAIVSPATHAADKQVLALQRQLVCRC
jgi:hypothetical protein